MHDEEIAMAKYSRRDVNTLRAHRRRLVENHNAGLPPGRNRQNAHSVLVHRQAKRKKSLDSQRLTRRIGIEGDMRARDLPINQKYQPIYVVVERNALMAP